MYQVSHDSRPIQNQIYGNIQSNQVTSIPIISGSGRIRFVRRLLATFFITSSVLISVAG